MDEVQNIESAFAFFIIRWWYNLPKTTSNSETRSNGSPKSNPAVKKSGSVSSRKGSKTSAIGATKEAGKKKSATLSAFRAARESHSKNR